MRLSIILLSYRRPDMLRQCLASLERAGVGSDVEVLVGFNGTDPAHAPLFEELPTARPWLRLFQLPRGSRGGARNLLVDAARGDCLFFLDDDTLVPEGFPQRVIEAFDAHPTCPVVGGPNVGPSDASAFERAVDRFFRHPISSGPLRIRFVRHGRSRVLPSWSFQLSNLGVRRGVFVTHGLRFSDRCVSAEENLLLHQIERNVGPALYSPDLYVIHRRRGRMRAFCRQIYLSGKGRMQVTRQAPRSFQAIVLAPLAGLAYLIALPLIPRSPVAFAPAAAYAALCAGGAAAMALRERDPAGALWLSPVMALGHLSYALGFLAGAFRR
ncbi:MAG: glycosyltransferase [Elusimicrobia bacterium]|nr:glycosyltransferase [Elusimicrobiota bacterium]